MTELKQISKSKCYEGDQFVFSHHSEVCNCDMTFGIYIPVHETNEKLRLIWFLSGLTCTHENAMVKSGIQRWASEEKIAVIFPDTSPRGEAVPDDDSFDLVDSLHETQTYGPWKKLQIQYTFHNFHGLQINTWYNRALQYLFFGSIPIILGSV